MSSLVVHVFLLNPHRENLNEGHSQCLLSASFLLYSPFSPRFYNERRRQPPQPLSRQDKLSLTSALLFSLWCTTHTSYILSRKFWHRIPPQNAAAQKFSSQDETVSKSVSWRWGWNRTMVPPRSAQSLLQCKMLHDIFLNFQPWCKTQFLSVYVDFKHLKNKEFCYFVCILLPVWFMTPASACAWACSCLLLPLKGAQKKANCFHRMNLIVRRFPSLHLSESLVAGNPTGFQVKNGLSCVFFTVR